ncbi:MAG TPA: response regulator transcription factor [Thermoleophilia bacterium]|nr:response regulator transcription factor [Thermoleophilia bacterium]
MGKPIRILVVDDDDNVRRLVAAYLEREGYAVTQAADGNSAIKAVETASPDLLILDLMLPGPGGLQVARRLKDSVGVPVIMLTARGEEDDVLRGFEAGADDYLVKPFSPKVLVARVRAVLRRAGQGADEDTGPVVRGPLVIDERSREASVDGVVAELTAIEFDLLRALADHPGWVYSREQLLESVWGYDHLGDSRVVDVHVANLRRKIGDDPTQPRFIRTVRGVGYKFQVPGE